MLCVVWGGLARSLAPSEVTAKARTVSLRQVQFFWAGLFAVRWRPCGSQDDDGTIRTTPWVASIVYGSFGGGLLVSLVLYRRQIVSCSYNLVATKNSSLVQIEDVGGPCARRMIRTAAPSTVSFITECI